MPSLFYWFGISFCVAQEPAFKKTIDGLLRFSVPQINCVALKEKLETTEKIYLLDARELEEFGVSHLKDAIAAGYNKFSLDKLSQIPKDKLVVVYCSVGYRSEKIGEKLLKAGYKKVYNLYGGIFEWSNLGYPLHNTSGKTTEVHAFDPSWGKWLKKAKKVY